MVLMGKDFKSENKDFWHYLFPVLEVLFRPGIVSKILAVRSTE